MKDEIKNLKIGSGSTVCSEASTGVGLVSGSFARPPPLTSGSCALSQHFATLGDSPGRSQRFTGAS